MSLDLFWAKIKIIRKRKEDEMKIMTVAGLGVLKI